MAKVLPIETPTLGDRNYLVHDGRVAVVVDPQRDTDRITALARREGVRISHVAETHIHNDYVSGGLALSRATGAAYLVNGADPVRFAREPVGDGDVIEVSPAMRMRVVATPGHTFSHLSYVLTAGDEVAGVFTGGSLLFGSSGRPDLLGPAHTVTLARAQHASARRLARELPDSAQVFPTHGFGSFCAATQAEATASTIGREKKVNAALTLGEEAYVETLLAGLDAYPAYYAHMGPVNLAGPAGPDLSPPAPADPEQIPRRKGRADAGPAGRPGRGERAMSVPGTEHHTIVIVGGGTAGITTAARLIRAGQPDVAVIEPSERHYYQPLFTVVGGGRAPQRATVRPEAAVMPKGARWIHESATAVDPDAQTVTTDAGRVVGYDYLVMAPGIQLDFGQVPGLAETLGRNRVSSNYRYDLTPRTWEFIRDLRSGTALFTMPAGPIKCAGAPQKIAYLAADWWRGQGVLDKIRVILVLPTAAMFSQPDWAGVLTGIAAGYGIEGRRESQLTEVDGDGRRAVIADTKAGTKETVDFDLLHVVPPQSAPDWVKASPLADPAVPAGYVAADKHTLVHPRWPNVYSLGDVANLPTSKTGAAIRKQAPVLVANLTAALRGQSPSARYDGYTSCPLVTSRNRMLLAEFDYDLKPRPSIPFIDTMKPRYDMWLLKRYGLPALYWNLMLRGRA